jgi:DNA-directed RNA polymerase specialized sigma24 family protein
MPDETAASPEFEVRSLSAPLLSGGGRTREAAGPGHLTEAAIALLRSAQAGDEASLTQFLLHAQQTIKHFLMSRSRGKNDPEEFVTEVLQDSLVWVARYYPNCRATHPSELASWLLTITRGRVVHYLRTYRPKDVALFPLSEANGCVGDDDPPSPLLFALMKMAVDCTNAIGQVNAKIVWQKLIDRLSWAEIGRDNSLTAGAVRRRFQTTQARLKREIEGQVAHLDSDASGPALRDLIARFRKGG